MQKRILSVIGLGVILVILTGCTTPAPKVNLFGVDPKNTSVGYIRTQAGDVVAGIETKVDGAWYSDEARKLLLNHGE
jgi:hypothetical protein